MTLLENSFYTDPNGLASLLGDKQKVADIFYTNFVGFAGLLKIKDAPTLDTYIKNFGKLQLSNMTDTNKDWALSVKLANDAGVINSVAANMATKFLALVKAGKVKGATLKEEPLRDILKACRIVTNKPSQRIYQAIQDFIDGKDGLESTTVKLWKLAARSENVDIAKEFREQITLGGYSSVFLQHQWTNGTATTPLPSATAQPALAQPPKKGQRGSLPPEGAAHGSDSDYMSALLHVFKLKGGIHSYLERFGFKGHFDVERFKKAVSSPEFVVAHGYHVPWEQHPFVQWIRKKDFAAAAAVVKILNDKDRQTANIAQATQVSNHQPPAPKPAVTVVPVIPDPVITFDSIEAFYKAKTRPEYDALVTKYHWPKGEVLTRNMLKNHKSDVSDALRKVRVPELLTSPDSFKMQQSLGYTVFGEHVKNSIGGDQLFLPILGTMQDAAAVHDEAGVLNLIHSQSNFQTLRDFGARLVGYGRNLPMEAVQTMVKKGDEINFVVRNAKLINQNKLSFVSSALYEAWNSSTPVDTLKQNLVQVVIHGSGHAMDAMSRAQIQKAFRDLGINVFLNGVTWTIDKDTYLANAPADLKALVSAVFNLSVLAFEIKELNANALKLQELKESLSAIQSNLTANTPRVVPLLKEAIAGTLDVGDLLKDEFQRINIAYMLGYEYGPTIDPVVKEEITNWLFSGMIKQLPLVWTIPQSYSYYNRAQFRLINQYVEWCSAKNHVDGIHDVADYALAHGPSASVMSKLIFANYPDLKSKVYASFKTRGVSGEQIALETNYEYDEDVLKDQSINVVTTYAAALANKGVDIGAVKAVNIGLKMFESTFNEPWTRFRTDYGSSVLNTCWFVKPSSPHYEAAKATAALMSAESMRTGMSEGIKKLVKLVNPEMFDFWFAEKKRQAKGDMSKTLQLADTVAPDEYAALAIEAIKAAGIDSIKADLTDANGVATRMMAVVNTDSVTMDVKKELVKKFATAMEVAGVHTIRDKGQRDYINKIYTEILLDVYDEDKNLANRIFKDLPRTTRTIIVQHQGEQEYMEAIAEDLYKHPIKPDFKLDHKRIRTILKYNRIPVKITSNRNIVQKIEDISDAVKRSITKVGDLKVTEGKLSQTDLDKATIRLNKFRNNMHGDVGIRILKSFDVDFPGNKARLEAFHKQWPRDGNLQPVFHGTGTVAASMVLRNGFQIIPSNDSSAVGRMLGNGIYFSNIVNKASQYVGDKGGGITRQFGTKGYIFEMEAELGLNPKHYKSAGTGGDRSTRSPEWAVFEPENQLRIYKAYYVELVNFKEIKELAEKYNEKLQESMSKSFTDFLYEAKEGENLVSTFWFMNDDVPEFKVRKNVYIEDSWDGGKIVAIEHSADIDPITVTVPNTTEWLATCPDEVKQFFDLIKA